MVVVSYLDVIARLERMREREGITEEEGKAIEERISWLLFVNESLQDTD
ncbi:hypothetical protein P4313_26920 [Bacillus tropicus]|nr:hypothetical protein [Bacillus tropicus]